MESVRCGKCGSYHHQINDCLQKDICKICDNEILDGQLHIENKNGIPTHHYECYGNQ